MRRKSAQIRKVTPDAIYKSVLLSKFINRLMCSGKKSVVEKSVYEAMNILESRIKKSPMLVIEEALENVYPRIEVRSRRIGGATYQIPTEVSPRRRLALALKWIKYSIQTSKGRDLSTKIVAVITDCLDNKGWAVKKKEEVFKMAEANKAFAHYRW